MTVCFESVSEGYKRSTIKLTMHSTLRAVSTMPCQNLTSAELGWTEKAPIFSGQESCLSPGEQTLINVEGVVFSSGARPAGPAAPGARHYARAYARAREFAVARVHWARILMTRIMKQCKVIAFLFWNTANTWRHFVCKTMNFDGGKSRQWNWFSTIIIINTEQLL